MMHWPDAIMIVLMVAVVLIWCDGVGRPRPPTPPDGPASTEKMDALHKKENP